MSSRRSKLAWFGVSSILLIGLIYFSDADKFIEAVRSADPFMYSIALLSGLLIFPIFANSWHQFLGKVGTKQKFTKSLRMFMGGQFLNSITPLGQFGGEPLMAYVIKNNTDLSYEKAFSTVLSADIINGIPPISFIAGGAIYLLLFQSLNHVVLQTLYIAIVVTCIGAPLGYLLWFRSGTLEGWIIKVLEKISELTGRGKSLIEKVEERFEGIQDAFNTIGESPRELVKVAVIAHLYFVVQIMSLYFVLLSLGINSNLTPLYFILVITGLSAYAPTPGGTGAAEATMATAITIFLPPGFATGLTAAILFRLTNYWPGILIGWLSLNSLKAEEEKIGLKSLKQSFTFLQ